MNPLMATLALALSGSAVAAPPDADTTIGLQPADHTLVLDQRKGRGNPRGGSSQGARQGAPAAGPHGAPPSARPQAAPSSSARPAGPPPQAAPRATSPGPSTRPAPASSPSRPTPSASHATPAPSSYARSNGQGHASHGNGVGQGHVSHGNGNGYGHTGGPPSHASAPSAPSHASGPSSHGAPSHGAAPSRPAAAPVQPRHVQAQAHPGYGSRPAPSTAAPRHAAPHHVPAHAPRHVPATSAPRHVPGHVRPAPRVVHHEPRPHHAHHGPRPAPHHAHHPHHAPVVVVQRHYTHIHPYHGVFVYGPAPVYHQQYVGSSGPVTVEEAHLPERKVDRDNSLAVGIRGGSFIGGYDTAAGFSDPGLGLNVRYRPDETVGLEVALSHYGMESDDSMRTNTVGQASVELFAWPWTRVSPYVLAGLTADGRNFDDDYLDTRTDTVQNLSAADVQWGPHAGLGIEFALGKSVALDLEARYIGFLTAGGEDPTLPGAVQTHAGVMVHF